MKILDLIERVIGGVLESMSTYKKVGDNVQKEGPRVQSTYIPNGYVHINQIEN